MRILRKLFCKALIVALVAACDTDDITAPYAKNLTLVPVTGDGQFALPGTMLPDPLQVRLEHVRTHHPAKGILVTWRVLQGSGAELLPATALTDANGIAATRVRLGSELETYTIEATFEGRWGASPQFTVSATPVPTITSIQPQPAQPGELVTIEGEHFRVRREDNSVFFDGMRATVTSATAGELRVVVPQCMTTRRAQVRVLLGSVASEPVSVSVHATQNNPLQLEVGSSARFVDAAAASCVRLSAASRDATFLVITQNTSTSGQSLAFQLAAVTAQAAPPRPLTAPSAGPKSLPAADAWDARLRQKEARLLARGNRLGRGAARSRTAPPPLEVGQERRFAAVDPDFNTIHVSAIVRAIGSHAVIYEDRSAPAGGFTSADFDELVRLFDNPIYPTDVEVFGEPSDLDGNGRVVILLTPAVNQLTPRESNGYIGGYFNPCDLQDDLECVGNLAEVFYAVVPDPEGRFGIKHSRETLVHSLPSVLAHEFQHMIHFNRRVLVGGGQDEALWLKEALAHSAEDTVGGVFLARGDVTRAQEFRRKNYIRAALYLADPAASIVDFTRDGTLEQRGGAWLFLKYLTDHFGGEVLQCLTDAAEAGATNVTRAVDAGWPTLLSRWAVSLEVAALPQLERERFDPRDRYIGFDLAQALTTVNSSYALRETRLPFSDFVLSGTLPAASSAFTVLTAGLEGTTLNFSASGPRGLAFGPGARPQITVVRLR